MHCNALTHTHTHTHTHRSIALDLSDAKQIALEDALAAYFAEEKVIPFVHILQGYFAHVSRKRADSRGTHTARGRQCRMSKKDKRRVRRGSREQKHTEHTNQFE